MKSPTLLDVAQLAGVSYATADRVLNRRGNVAEKSVRKVEEAMAQLGYIRNVAAANLSRNRRHRLAFVLPRQSHSFFGRMHEQLRRAEHHMKAARVQLDIVEFEAFDAGALDTALTRLLGQKYDGIAFVGQGHSEALAALRAQGTKVVSLVSDAPEHCRDHYIGIDNVKAGRTAARLIGMTHRGKAGHVILTAGSLEVRDHSDRIYGFKEVLRSDFPQITVSELIETKDQDRLMREALRARLAEEDGATAIYNAGAGNDGLIEVVRMLDLRAQLFCVVHEVSGKIREALEEGVIDVAIDQRPEIEMNRALALLQAIVDDLPPPPAPELIPAIYVRDNLPDEHS
ncbi:LacI family DNA-binding transcriptional regulator [Nitratireductor sp. ZSWI3]|uniref:LacI family DNA-binding transcriptional regulator n=1 Tax=Nitratireductor sp. ZSWI3 TaxID=2966359 RepID=UPI00214FE01F|nr:LacI family DNA-binding transcriptional regulator [Nitratireductor sp. ZSWI3]MCR4265206.1 LacI family DNA-binding transcriptional regulator [Nitratireductor sp. ZSWI3]